MIAGTVERPRPSGRANARTNQRSSASERERSVELWVRGGSPGCVRDALQETQDDLRKLRESDTIDSLAVRQWNDVARESRTQEGDRDATCRGKLAEFERWASNRGYALYPGFQVRELRPMVGDGAYRKFVFPVRCLAIYDGDALEAVYPYADGDDVYTVTDGLRRLQRDTGAAPASSGGEWT